MKQINHLAEQHRWVPDSGWTTFRMCGDSDVEHAVWLMRLSYLRYTLKTVAEPAQLLVTETERLHLSPALVTILTRFIPAGTAAAEGLSIPA